MSAHGGATYSSSDYGVPPNASRSIRAPATARRTCDVRSGATSIFTFDGIRIGALTGGRLIKPTFNTRACRPSTWRPAPGSHLSKRKICANDRDRLNEPTAKRTPGVGERAASFLRKGDAARSLRDEPGEASARLGADNPPRAWLDRGLTRDGGLRP